MSTLDCASAPSRVPKQELIELEPYDMPSHNLSQVLVECPSVAKIPDPISETSILSPPMRGPDPRSPQFIQSHSALDLLSPRSISDGTSYFQYGSPRTYKAGYLDSSHWGQYGYPETLDTGTTEDPSSLLTPPASKRQQFSATRLPTVPIPQTSSEQPWVIQGTGFMSNFEPVPVKLLIIHTVLCFIAFPFVYLLCSAGSGRTLFLSRSVVGAVCGLTGLVIGYNLIQLSRRGIEAALWATIIHESMRPDGGVTLGQLNNYIANPSSPGGAISLLFRRIFRHTGTKRTHRSRYDRTPWTCFIVMFLVVTTVSACLVFIFARIVDIYTEQERQLSNYVDTTVIGDLSAADVERAATLIERVYSNYNFTWSLIPVASGGVIPIGRSFTENRLQLDPLATKNVTDTVYFAETYPAQLAKNGFGFGTFANQHTSVLSASRSAVTQSRGETLRWPRWGIRAGCKVLEDLNKYLVPLSPVNNMTYLFVPKTAMYSLFADMDIPYPGLPPVNFTTLMIPGDVPPSNIVQADTAVAAKWWQNGVAHSFKSVPISDGSDGRGWLQVDIVLVRLHQAYAPNGNFSVYAYPDKDYISSAVGYDAAICVEEYKPYMVDAYNNTAGSPSTLGLVHRGLNFDEAINVPQTTTMQNDIQWGIDSIGKASAFRAAYINSRNVMLKDNGRAFYYVPNPTLLSFTDGSEAYDYTKLDPLRTAAAIARADSQHLLPYLAGSQPVTARCYPDKTLAYIHVSKLWLGVLLLNMLLLGYAVAIFVPRLPLGLPRRDLGVFSWLAAIEGDAILGIPTGVGRHEHLDELKRRGKDVKIRYNAPNERDWALPESDRAHREFFERQYTIQ